MFRGFKGIIAVCILAVLLGSVSAYAFFSLKNVTPLELLKSPLVQHKMEDLFGENQEDFSTLLPLLLGLSEPRTYLFLFQNNTEIRPGGGFIGVYATVHLEEGNFRALKVEGTELLDKQSPDTYKPEPPKVITEHLGVDRWYFRDSNWSPDFSVSAQKALELYKGEGGIAAEEIDTVVAVTPTVLERIIKITGPITVEGTEFTSENVTEKLEYEVEYDYEDNGRTFEHRKVIIKTFMEQLLNTMKKNILFHSAEYIRLVEDLTAEKHILFYSKDEDIARIVGKLGWDGRMSNPTGDYIMWVDANLAALKTDHAIKRDLSYSIEPRGDDFVARVQMKYTHTGAFDWRTSRYRTYARVYVPSGAKLIDTQGNMKWDRTAGRGPVDEGEELRHHWFGAFIAIEPGAVGTLEFSYILPKHLGDQIKAGKYTLMAQKQLGLPNVGLSMNLNFGKNVTSATPAEQQKDWGNPFYTIQTDLIVDRTFEVGL